MGLPKCGVSATGEKRQKSALQRLGIVLSSLSLNLIMPSQSCVDVSLTHSCVLLKKCIPSAKAPHALFLWLYAPIGCSLLEDRTLSLTVFASLDI